MVFRNKALGQSAGGSETEKALKEPGSFASSADGVKPGPEGVAAFPRFGEFPAEVRLQIWKEALPGPRVVQLEPRSLKTHQFVSSSKRKS